MTHAETRAAMIACARKMLTTPFRHQGRSPRSVEDSGGLDCLGLLIAVAEEAALQSRAGGALADYDHLGYSHMADATMLRNTLEQCLYPRDIDALEAGDIALFEIDGAARHLAIIGDYPYVSSHQRKHRKIADDAPPLSLIHAFAPARAVIEHRFDVPWRNKFVAGFSVFA